MRAFYRPLPFPDVGRRTRTGGKDAPSKLAAMGAPCVADQATLHRFAPAKQAAPVFFSQSSVLSRQSSGGHIHLGASGSPAALNAAPGAAWRVGVVQTLNHFQASAFGPAATRNRVDSKAVAHDRTKDIDCSVEADPDDAWT